MYNQILLHKLWWKELSQYHDWILDLQKWILQYKSQIIMRDFSKILMICHFTAWAFIQDALLEVLPFCNANRNRTCNSAPLLKLQQTKQVTTYPYGTTNLRESLFDLRICWQFSTTTTVVVKLNPVYYFDFITNLLLINWNVLLKFKQSYSIFGVGSLMD